MKGILTSNSMKHSLVIFVFLAMGTTIAQAETAFFQYRIEPTTGFYDQCVYESTRGQHIINVRKTDLCPLTIEV